MPVVAGGDYEDRIPGFISESQRLISPTVPSCWAFGPVVLGLPVWRLDAATGSQLELLSRRTLVFDGVVWQHWKPHDVTTPPRPIMASASPVLPRNQQSLISCRDC